MRHFFPERAEGQQQEMVGRLLATSAKRTIVQTETLMEVLQEVAGTEDGAEFRDLRDQVEDQQRQAVIKKRLFASRSKVEHETPSPIKALRPDHPGVVLTYQIPADRFCAY